MAGCSEPTPDSADPVPRALAIRYLNVASDEAATYRARLAERVASARACGHHLWAFGAEAADGPPGVERIVEFVETSDPAALGTALAQDALLDETLDFRHAPPAAAPPSWERFAGIADA